MTRVIKFASLSVLLMGLLGCSSLFTSNSLDVGCANGHQCVLKPMSAPQPRESLPPDDSKPLVGIAISGGGSRAATFAEAVLEELAKVDVGTEGKPVSLLEHVGYISGVSGGSLATAYYALNKPNKNVPVLAGQELSKDYIQFFVDYREGMQTNWEGALWEPILDDATGRAFAVANKWDDKLFHNSTFNDLLQRERNGDAPWVILNGTNWNNGRRFVFTNLPEATFSYDFVKRTIEYIRGSRIPQDEVERLDERLKPEEKRFRPMTAEEIGADLSDLRVSIAVASSASVPLLIGPVLYSVGPVDCRRVSCLHIGDGGMFDNQGVESLAQVFFGKLLTVIPADSQSKSPARKGLMMVIDGSYPMHDVNFGEAPTVFTYLVKSPSRVSDIMEERALGYQLLLWSILRADTEKSDRVIPDPQHLQLIYFRHIDAATAIAAQPSGVCGYSQPVKEQDVESRLRSIPTRFKIDKSCDAPLLREAAKELVKKNKDRIQQFFRNE